MSPRNLIFFLACVLLVLPACGSETKKSKPKLAATVSSAGPAVATKVIPPPVLQPPSANEVLYVAHIVDKATGKPIGGAFCSLLRSIPTSDYMRRPKRSAVIFEGRTPLHGQNYTKLTGDKADKNGVKIMDGKMKWWLIAGRGFTPKIVEAGPAVAGTTQEVTIRTTISPVIEFRVLTPKGDLANNAVCTMAPDVNQPQLEGKMASRSTSSGNVGMTERADDAGEVFFNRSKGRYRLSFNDEKGRYRYYEIFEFDGVNTTKPIKIHLPAKSMDKPW